MAGSAGLLSSAGLLADGTACPFRIHRHLPISHCMHLATIILPPSLVPVLQPITMMRNALGREEGGSGVALDREQYEAATAYWEAHAAIQ